MTMNSGHKQRRPTGKEGNRYDQQISSYRRTEQHFQHNKPYDKSTNDLRYDTGGGDSICVVYGMHKKR